MHNSFKTTHGAVVMRAVPFWFIAGPTIAEANAAAIPAQKTRAPYEDLCGPVSAAHFPSNGMGAAGAACEGTGSSEHGPIGFS